MTGWLSGWKRKKRKKKQDESTLRERMVESVRKANKTARVSLATIDSLKEQIVKLKVQLSQAQNGRRDWFEKAERWQKKVEEQERVIQELESQIKFYRGRFLMSKTELLADPTDPEVKAVRPNEDSES